MDPFADAAVSVHVTVIVTSAWNTEWVRTSRVGARGEVIGYQVTDSVGLHDPHATFAAALLGHSRACTAYGEAAREAGDVMASNYWAREALHLGIAGEHEPGPLDGHWP